MRIALVKDASTWYLAGQSGVDERVHSSAGNFQITAEASSQLIQRIRAATAPTLDRANLSTTISFSTSRLFATAADAFLYCLDHDAGFAREGTLVMTVGASTRHLLDCVVKPPSRSCIGCTVLLNYTATGSKIITA